jgi:hypothetical protein
MPAARLDCTGARKLTMTRFLFISCTLAALLSARTALAHDLWIEPSAFHPAVGAKVTGPARRQARAGESLPGTPSRARRRSREGGRVATGEKGRQPAAFGSAVGAADRLSGCPASSHPMQFETHLSI